jgi:predicted RNA-binding protein with TRAM domain
MSGGRNKRVFLVQFIVLTLILTLTHGYGGVRKPAQPQKEWFGLRVTTVTPDIAKQLGLAKAEGVAIESVEAGSAAQDAGLRKGDVILEVNRQRIRNEDDYRKAMEKAKPVVKDVSKQGDGVGAYQQFAVFVPDAKEGEVVQVKIIEVKKNCAVGKKVEDLRIDNGHMVN